MLRKIESLIFYLFIFCIPFQSRLILARWTSVRVGFNEWTSAFLHGTDILIITLLVLWLIRLIQGESRIKLGRHDIFLVIFFLISALSISASHTKALSVYQLIKLAEFIAFYFYIRSNLGRIFNLENLIKVLVLSGFFQAIIAIIQYSIQGALGLRLLGESPITAGGPGVASFYVGSNVYLRAYGTFPHPNLLATFLILAIAGFYYLYFNGIQVSGIKYPVLSIRNLISGKYQIPNTKYLILALPVYSTMLYAFFLTYSRTAIGLFVLALIAFLAIQIYQGRSLGKCLFQKRVYILIIVTAAVVLLFLGLNFQQAVTRALISGSDEAVSLRLFYSKVAGQTTGHYPWLGVGIGGFVPKLMNMLPYLTPYYYQPVHNIYLLISTETGILGITSFLLFLFFLIRNFIKHSNLKNPSKFGLLLVCFTILAIGLFDHLPWTIQQGRIILWLTLALL